MKKEIRDLPLLQILQERHPEMFALARKMRSKGFPPSYLKSELNKQFGAKMIYHFTRILALHRSISARGIREGREPKVNEDRVIDGFHRICYYIAMDLPCIVEVQ